MAPPQKNMMVDLAAGGKMHAITCFHEQLPHP
jgi:hypothetical protein